MTITYGNPDAGTIILFSVVGAGAVLAIYLEVRDYLRARRAEKGRNEKS